MVKSITASNRLIWWVLSLSRFFMANPIHLLSALKNSNSIWSARQGSLLCANGCHRALGEGLSLKGALCGQTDTLFTLLEILTLSSAEPAKRAQFVCSCLNTKWVSPSSDHPSAGAGTHTHVSLGSIEKTGSIQMSLQWEMKLKGHKQANHRENSKWI